LRCRRSAGADDAEFTTGAASVKSACAPPGQRIVTAHKFLELAKLEAMADDLSASARSFI